MHGGPVAAGTSTRTCTRTPSPMLSYPATWYLSDGYQAERQPYSAHPSVVPFQFFATADGHVAISCAKQKFFVALVGRLGRPELASDPRFATFGARLEHRAELLELLTAAVRGALHRRAGRPCSKGTCRLRPSAPCPRPSIATSSRRSGCSSQYEHPAARRGSNPRDALRCWWLLAASTGERPSSARTPTHSSTSWASTLTSAPGLAREGAFGRQGGRPDAAPQTEIQGPRPQPEAVSLTGSGSASLCIPGPPTGGGSGRAPRPPRRVRALRTRFGSSTERMSRARRVLPSGYCR